MKRLLLFVALLCSFSVHGQYAIKGSIRNYDNKFEPIMCSVMVNPKIDSLFLKKISQPFNHYHFKYLKADVSDMKGEFMIKDISLKKIDLFISALGFEKMLIKNITFNKDTIFLNTIYMLRTPTISGWGDMHKGDLENRCKVNDSEFKIEYPKDGKKLKMKYKNGMIIVDYKDLLNHNKTDSDQ